MVQPHGISRTSLPGALQQRHSMIISIMCGVECSVAVGKASEKKHPGERSEGNDAVDGADLTSGGDRVVPYFSHEANCAQNRTGCQTSQTGLAATLLPRHESIYLSTTRVVAPRRYNFNGTYFSHDCTKTKTPS
jgi:hypothetical protein